MYVKGATSPTPRVFGWHPHLLFNFNSVCNCIDFVLDENNSIELKENVHFSAPDFWDTL